jgi:hypothetical protein
MTDDALRPAGDIAQVGCADADRFDLDKLAVADGFTGLHEPDAAHGGAHGSHLPVTGGTGSGRRAGRATS